MELQSEALIMSYDRNGKTCKNEPFYFAASEAVCSSPRPAQGHTRPNPTKIVPRVLILPRGPPGA